MKANHQIEPGLFPNESLFKDEFFKRFKLRNDKKPLELDFGIEKNYFFPTFYADVTCAIGIFFCDYEAALSIMPHKDVTPVKGTKGRAIVIFSCYEYKNVLGIAPYNEIAMTIPVMYGKGFNPPLLPLVMKSFKNMGYYVFSMPVTSYENKLRGRKIWGLPKDVEDIDLEVSNNFCTTKAYDENGKEYFSLSLPTTGKKTHFDEKGYLYSVLNNKLLKSPTYFKSDFNVQKNMSLIWNKGKTTDKPALVLGDSPKADILRKLKIEQIPFQTRFAPNMNSCFDLYETQL